MVQYSTKQALSCCQENICGYNSCLNLPDSLQSALIQTQQGRCSLGGTRATYTPAAIASKPNRLDSTATPTPASGSHRRLLATAAAAAAAVSAAAAAAFTLTAIKKQQGCEAQQAARCHADGTS
jgi:hypothetical protein